MPTTHFLPDESGSTERPQLIAILGLLTFVNAGLFIVMYALAILAMLMVRELPVDEFVQLLRDGALKYMDAEQAEPMERIALVLHRSGVAIMIVYLVRTVLRLIGAIGMWRGKKSGFHLYAVAQLLGLFAPHLFLPWDLLGVGGPLMTVAITAAYGSQLKRLA